MVVGTVYEHRGPPNYLGPLPLATRVVRGLVYAHWGVSMLASVAVVLLTHGAKRWFAWAAILAIGGVASLLGLGAAMATSGISF
jgi:hypothetical protein